MRKQLTRIKLLAVCFAAIFCGDLSAQLPTYTATIENDLMVSSSIYEFDLIISQTGSLPLELANFQAAIMVNPAFVNGGIITPTLLGGSSDFNTPQWPSSIKFQAGFNCIMIAPKVPPRVLFPGSGTSATNGTIIATTGTRVCRIKLENSVPFGDTYLDPIWNFTLQPYRTAVTAYVGPTDQRINTFITLADAHSKTLNLSVLVEGLYDPSTGGLVKTQDADGDYNTWDKFPGLIADTLTIQLAETTPPYNTLYSVHGVNLNTTGRCRVPVPGNLSGNYYIIFNHRNSIETWSKAGGESFAANSTSLNLTSNASQAYGSNLKQVASGKYALYSGDVSTFGSDEKDGYIDFFDINSTFNLSSQSAYGYQDAELTGDGFVDIFDVNTAYNNSANSIGWNSPRDPAKKQPLNLTPNTN
jgi:hypothetical protein